MIGARTDIRFKVYRAVGIASGIELIQSASAISIDVRVDNAEVHPSSGKQPHTARSQILRRCQKVGRQFVINGQASSVDIEVTAPVSLQGPRLLKIGNVASQAAQVWNRLLIRRQERCAGATGVEIDKRSEPVAFQAGIEIIVLGGAVVNSKTRPNDRLSVECTRRPCQADSGIEVFIVRGIKFGVLWAGGRSGGGGEGAIGR